MDKPQYIVYNTSNHRVTPKGGPCIKGGIYSDQRCKLCGESFRDNGYDGLVCENHPDERATKFKAKFMGLCNRFNTYLPAKRRLEAWRQEVDDGVFDIRLHKKDSPLSIGRVIEDFIKLVKEPRVRRGKIKAETVEKYWAMLMRFVDFVGPQCLISTITHRVISKWLSQVDLAPKTVHESYRVLREVLVWAYHDGSLPTLPRFPTYDFDPDQDMEMRETVSKDKQVQILAQVYKNEWERVPRRYVGCRFLATYINVRPGELRGVKEKEFNREEGLLVIRKHKGSRTVPKIVRLLPEDVTLLESLPRGFPEMPLFRYDYDHMHMRAGDALGIQGLYRTWKRACSDLGIEGVDLYGGTRHSSAIALYKEAGIPRDEIKLSTGHATTKSFMRYLPMDVDMVANIHRHARPSDPEKFGSNKV